MKKLTKGEKQNEFSTEVGSSHNAGTAFLILEDNSDVLLQTLVQLTLSSRVNKKGSPSTLVNRAICSRLFNG